MSIKVDYDSRTLRLVMTGPFYCSDILRSFPSRRFEPKSKTWRMPLVKQNINHLTELINKKLIQDVTPKAAQVLLDYDRLTQGPVYQPFPMSYFDGLDKRPFPHQEDMLNKGWALNGFAVFAEMGTGKTFTTIAMLMARFSRNQIQRAVIICPETLRRTWRKEFAKYARPDTYDIRDHAASDKRLMEWATDGVPKLKVLLVSVEGLGISAKLYDSVCAFYVGFNRIATIVDESSRIKNPQAVRTKRAIELGALSAYRMILNGTPIAKGIQDLWSQFEFLDPNIIGSGDYWSFKTRYLEMGGYENKAIVGYKNVDELMNMVKPYSIDVRKKLLNLPDKTYKQLFVEPTPEQRKLFKTILTGVGAESISVKNVLERMLRLQQVIGGFEPRTDRNTGETTTSALEKNPKMSALLDFIDENREGTKFIIWARYIPEIKMIVGALQTAYGKQSVLTYYGETTKEERAEAEHRYCNDPTARFLVGNPSAAGLGLTLISGENDVMFYYSGTFAYIDRAQSEDRSHRIGQKNNVLIVDCIMQGSIDEAISEAIAQKKDIDTFVKDQVASGKSVKQLLEGE